MSRIALEALEDGNGTTINTPIPATAAVPHTRGATTAMALHFGRSNERARYRAHREQSLVYCDRIVRFENGKFAAGERVLAPQPR
jgi:hypothetical protein